MVGRSLRPIACECVKHECLGGPAMLPAYQCRDMGSGAAEAAAGVQVLRACGIRADAEAALDSASAPTNPSR